MLDICTGGNLGSFSCAVRTDIAVGSVKYPKAVHPFATGVGTTDTTATRDWIAQNLLGVSEFGNELAANHTALVRSKYAIDDRINKAYYISPGYDWATLPGSAPQASLSLSDKMIAVAIIQMVDAGGNTVFRRLLTIEQHRGTRSRRNAAAAATLSAPLSKITPTKITEKVRALRASTPPGHVTPASTLPGHRLRSARSNGPGAAGRTLRMSRRSFAPGTNGRRSSAVSLQPKSDDEKIANALKRIEETPRSGALPPMEFNVNVGRQMASILGIPHDKWGMIEVDVKGRFHNAVTMAEINDILRARVNRNIGHFCHTCTNAVPVFFNLNVERGASTASGSRRLLEDAGAQGLVDYTGSVSLMLSYEQLKANKVLYEEFFKSLLDSKYRSVFLHALRPARDPVRTAPRA